MNGASWYKFRGFPASASTVSLNGRSLLDGQWSDTEETVSVTVPYSKDSITVDTSILGAPLGRLWRVLYQNHEHTALKDVLLKYWKHTGVPMVEVDLIKGKLEDEESNEDRTIVLRNRVLPFKEESDGRFQRAIEGVQQSGLGFDRAVVGSWGHNIELQFLNTKLRQQVSKGDFVDCGLFVALNGDVRVSAGLNRLVCTNGLVQKMDVWHERDYSFSPEYVTSASRLMEWFKSIHGEKVGSVREISVVLDLFPKTFVNKFWKKWSERIELKELTWYEVIDDLTRAVNTTLGAIRYNTLEVSQRIQGYGQRCHTCQAQVTVK